MEVGDYRYTVTSRIISAFYFCIKVDSDGSQVISLMVSEDVKHHVY